MIPRALILALALPLAACGGDDGSGDGLPAPDAAAQAVDAAPPGADAAACAPGECPCFSNHDCPEGTACTSQDDTGEEVYCTPGPRGTGEVGAPCDGEEDCASALCVEDIDDQLRCSDLCDDESDCPESLPVCLYIGFGVDESICARSG